MLVHARAASSRVHRVVGSPAGYLSHCYERTNQKPWLDTYSHCCGWDNFGPSLQCLGCPSCSSNSFRSLIRSLACSSSRCTGALRGTSGSRLTTMATLRPDWHATQAAALWLFYLRWFDSLLTVFILRFRVVPVDAGGWSAVSVELVWPRWQWGLRFGAKLIRGSCSNYQTIGSGQI